jgi:hypothetical protein
MYFPLWRNSSIEIEKEYTIKANIGFDFLDIENIKSKGTILGFSHYPS